MTKDFEVEEVCEEGVRREEGDEEEEAVVEEGGIEAMHSSREREASARRSPSVLAMDGEVWRKGEWQEISWLKASVTSSHSELMSVRSCYYC